MSVGLDQCMIPEYGEIHRLMVSSRNRTFSFLFLELVIFAK
ncbi:unnamed protein product [Acanthoscelides obtectus]|uniref:Uncharacterized protein n=1 Tax=Acanthoscelides obtectus TaxID=200917 RepID=A0A9P0L7B1_ACAOB|nr:unnamed protein product [Acanthoscelides obtectus]CAK1677948.1 hypothetical protein AOBTE_LOCUS31667 [Acanthoscelides obtectus]